MKGYSPKIPYVKESLDGFSINKTAVESIKQDLKMLLLTSPGERMMNPNYGIGIKRYLFEQESTINQDLYNNIVKQVDKYMNFIQIKDIQISKSDEVSVKIILFYFIPSLNMIDQIDLALSTN